MINWRVLETRGTLEAIDAAIDTTEQAIATANNRLTRLLALRDTRAEQIAAGQWPPPRRRADTGPRP